MALTRWTTSGPLARRSTSAHADIEDLCCVGSAHLVPRPQVEIWRVAPEPLVEGDAGSEPVAVAVSLAEPVAVVQRHR